MHENYVKLQSLLAEGKTIEICFVPGPIEDLECYAEPHMKAIVVGFNLVGDPNDEVAKLRLDYSKFDEFNKAFEKANYYNKLGVPCLTAREAGIYSVKDYIYIDTNTSPEDYFYWSVVDPSVCLDCGK